MNANVKVIFITILSIFLAVLLIYLILLTVNLDNPTSTLYNGSVIQTEQYDQ